MGDFFDSPDPPNPFQTASAQTGSNVSTAVANAFLGNVNQQTPTGSLTYNPTGSYAWADPTTGVTYNIPTFTATQTLSPNQQTLQNLNEASQIQLAGAGYEQASKLRGILGTNINLSGAPAAGNAATLANAPQAQTTFGDAGAISTGFGPSGNIKGDIDSAGNINRQFDQVGDTQRQFGQAGNIATQFGQVGPTAYGFGGAGDITKTYGDFANERNRIEQGLMDRLNPSLAIERQKYEQQLADQGIRYGSEAYSNAMRNYSMQANDARLAAIGQAGQEQQRMADMAAQRAGFQNAAQQQEFQQAQARGAFYNAAQGQAFGQEQARGTFANTAQQQLYQQQLGRGQFENAAQQQAYQQALGRGTFENAAQQQEFAQNAAQSEFYNKAQQQLYEQLYGREQFANQAQNQLFQQNAARGSFANTALAQNFQQQQAAFNAAQASRSQYWNEQFALRNQPINEVTALLSGSQVSQPNFVGSNMPTIPTTDIAGLLNTNFNQQMDAFKQNSTNVNSLIGGLLGFGGNVLRSDRTVKDNVDRIGTIFGTTSEGEEKLPIYQYSYKDDPTKQRHVGPMAQDVEKIDKRAVRKIGGVKHIDTGKLGEILKVA